MLALDKYNIYLFITNSIEDFKLNQYRNFQLILPMRFHFMRYFVNSIIFRVSHRLLYCVFIEVDFEKQKMLEIFIFLHKKVNLERKTQHPVITHANTSNGIKIPTFFEKNWGMMLYLSNATLIRPMLLHDGKTRPHKTVSAVRSFHCQSLPI